MQLTRRSLLAGLIAVAPGSQVFGQVVTPPPRRLPRIAVLATGGTIASTAPTATQTTNYEVTQGVDALIKAVPGLSQIAELSGEQIVNVSSGNITVAHLLALARRLNALLASDAIDGAVVTHGTDTLEETAYFLNLTVKSAKPVVITGAMRPGSATSADGPMNLYQAVLVAGNPEARGKGVLVLLNDRIGAARDVTKTNTTSLDTFRSDEQGFLGSVTAGVVHIYNAPLRRHTFATEFDLSRLDRLPRVDIIYEYQASSGDHYASAAALGARGIVVAGIGSGGFSDDTDKAVRAITSKGVIVARSSRTGSGVVPRRSKDAAAGIVSADNLNPQKARVLLMLALTRTNDPERIQRMFDTY